VVALALSSETEDYTFSNANYSKGVVCLRVEEDGYLLRQVLRAEL
jgi:hypothetical protein